MTLWKACGRQGCKTINGIVHPQPDIWVGLPSGRIPPLTCNVQSHAPSFANSFSRPSDECLVAPGVKHAGVSGKSIKAASLLASSTKTFLPHTTYGTRLHVPDNDTRHNAKTRTTVAQSRALGRLQMKLRKNGCNPGRGDNGPPRLCC